METTPRFVDADEFRSVDLPGRATRRGIVRSRAGKTMNSFATLLVYDRSQSFEITGENARFFHSLPPRSGFELFPRVRNPLGNTPRLATVVISRGMHEEHLQPCRRPP